MIDPSQLVYPDKFLFDGGHLSNSFCLNSVYFRGQMFGPVRTHLSKSSPSYSHVYNPSHPSTTRSLVGKKDQ